MIEHNTPFHDSPYNIRDAFNTHPPYQVAINSRPYYLISLFAA